MLLEHIVVAIFHGASHVYRRRVTRSNVTPIERSSMKLVSASIVRQRRKSALLNLLVALDFLRAVTDRHALASPAISIQILLYNFLYTLHYASEAHSKISRDADGRDTSSNIRRQVERNIHIKVWSSWIIVTVEYRFVGMNCYCNESKLLDVLICCVTRPS